MVSLKEKRDNSETEEDGYGLIQMTHIVTNNTEKNTKQFLQKYRITPREI